VTMEEAVEIELAGRKLSLEIGKLARQADGSAWVRYGDTIVLVTACSVREPQSKHADFLPLIVDYREYTYSAGKIPGGFYKREGRPSEKEILTARLVDRSIRPQFPDGYNNETQVIGSVISADAENDPDLISLIGASAALYLSPIPYAKPLGAARVGMINDEFVLNPTRSQLEASGLDMIVAGNESGVVMVELGASEVSELTVLKAIQFAEKPIKELIELQKGLFERLGVDKLPFEPAELSAEMVKEVEEEYGAKIEETLKVQPKRERYLRFQGLLDSLLAGIPEDDEERRAEAKVAFGKVKEEIFRKGVLSEKKRYDGRGFEDIRTLNCKVGLLPRTHGSALFTRGETQSLATVTLGTESDAQRVDGIGEEFTKRFILHYNFPPFSVGEVKFMRGPGRREVGHGSLAERALYPLIPLEEDFPYTIRLVSDILESNGSSSMATVCSGSLSLMDAGVPIREAVAGVAIGLIKEGDDYSLLTDIAGEEDHFGDMDFKVAGTARGITAVQLDIKINHLPYEIIKTALDQAKRARLIILERMNVTIASPRADISSYAPRLIQLEIPVDKIGDVIGPGGKMIRSIIAETGAKIDINDDGRVTIASPDEEAAKRALKMVKDLIAEPEVGRTYQGKIVRLVDFGAFVEIMPGVEGLLHISEVASHRVANIRDELKEGQTILVKVLSIDGPNRIRLSRKALLGHDKRKPSPRGERRDQDYRRR
jgi:polyribonucleotide nucleotidyltransferase